MSLLTTDHVQEIIRQAEIKRDSGSQYIVLEIRPMDAQLKPHNLDYFETLDNVFDYLDEKENYEYIPGFGNVDEHPMYYQPIGKFLEEIKAANDNQLNSKNMNLNNLQDLRKEVASLGFSPKVADELEKNMRTLPQHFTIKDQLPGDRGQVDLTLHFHKSGMSDTYNFGKFEATAGKVPPTPDNQSYMVLTENKDNKEKPLVKTFESPNEAIDFFKKQKGKSELALGESLESRQLLASRENGKENFVHDDFRGAYYSPAIKQTFYLKEGAGFTASQAANMVQGRTVHRDNMVNPRSGEQYQAWIKLDTAQGKDDWGNFRLKQMNDPAFGFNVEKALKDFKIKELSDPAKKEAIVSAIKNGDRVEITAVNREGKDVKVKMEADPQYKTLNFFTEKGAREKREQYKKPDVAQSQGRGQGQAKEKELEQGQSVGIR